MNKTILHIGCLIASLAAFSACTKDDYKPGQPSEKEEETYTPAERIDGRVAVGYVTYYGSKIPEPAVLTHICYAFAELYIKDGKYAGFKLQGNESRFKSIADLKKSAPDLKILLSFTHTVSNSDNVQAGGFSLMSKTEEGRKGFAEDCKSFLINWGIDGIDIDWELPGISWSGHACDPAVDTENHVKLIKQLRETLGTKYLVTLAGYVMDKQPTGDGGYKYVDIKAVEPYVDFINIMTYDLDAAPNHHSALDDPSAYWDCKRTINAYKAAGFPTSKMVLGIPFYGRHSFDVSPTAINYNKILGLDTGTYQIDNWDAGASVPYVTNKKTKAYYCGYDNAQSIALKGDWIRSLGLKGMMFWDYDGDDYKGTLRHAVWEAVMKP